MSYLKRSDLEISESSVKSINSAKKVQEIISSLSNINSVVDIITAIEKFNTENDLYTKNGQIIYGIGIGEIYYTVLKSEIIYEKIKDDKGKVTDGEPTLLKVVTRDITGYTKTEFNSGVKATKSRNVKSVLSTHYIPVKMITDIIFNDVDTDFYNEDSVDVSINDFDAIGKQLDVLSGDLNSLIVAGRYNSAIKKFNFEFNDKRYHKIDYVGRVDVYNKYVKCVAIYLNIIREISTSYKEFKYKVSIGYKREALTLNNLPKFLFLNSDITNAQNLLLENPSSSNLKDLLDERTFNNDMLYELNIE